MIWPRGYESLTLRTGVWAELSQMLADRRGGHGRRPDNEMPRPRCRVCGVVDPLTHDM